MTICGLVAALSLGYSPSGATLGARVAGRAARYPHNVRTRPPPGAAHKGATMARWYNDPGLRRLVKERNAGDLSRREFLARLGGTAAGAAAVSFAGAGPARAQKKIVVTTWDTEPNPSTRAAMKAIVEDFHKLHKDIEVRAEGMGWGDMDRKLQAAMAAKSPPTASHTQTYVVTSFRDKGLIEPVDDIVKAIGEDKIFPAVLRWLKYPDGKYWGITHAWGAEILGGRGDYLAGTGVNPQSWKTWDDWLRDLPKLNKAPQHYGLSLAGIPFFVNEDVYMWTGANGGSLFDAKGQPALESPQVLGMLEFWKKLKPYLPPGWASHDYLETLSAWATGKTAQVLMWGRTAGYIDQYAPPDKRNPEVFQVWPKTTGPMGKAPLTQFDNEPWVGDVAAAPILADMVMAVVERGRDPKVAAREASDKISRDIIGKTKS